jgi:hypothetical protein
MGKLAAAKQDGVAGRLGDRLDAVTTVEPSATPSKISSPTAF